MARNITENTDLSAVMSEVTRLTYEKNSFWAKIRSDYPSLTKDEYYERRKQFDRIKREHKIASDHLARLKAKKR